MSDIEDFITRVREQHKLLTEAFEAAQAAQREATANCRIARDELVAFRETYGGHLKLADAGTLVASP